MMNEYLFEVFPALGGDREVWACTIPASVLRDIDKGAYIILTPRRFGPASVAAGTAQWGRIQGVSHGKHIVDSIPHPHVWVWVDGVQHRLSPEDEVWLGYNPDGPAHLQRGGFTREVPEPPPIERPPAESGLTGRFHCKVGIVTPLLAFDQLVAEARQKLAGYLAKIRPQPGDTIEVTIDITGKDPTDSISAEPATRHCCQLNCEQEAEFEVIHNCPGSHSSDGCGTDACAVHLGALLRGCIHGIDYVTEYTVTDISERE